MLTIERNLITINMSEYFLCADKNVQKRESGTGLSEILSLIILLNKLLYYSVNILKYDNL